MHPRTQSFLLSGSLLLAGVAVAGGRNESLLQQALMANAQGECPAALLSDPLRTSCDSQIADVRDTLAKLGKITRVAYLGLLDTPAGKAERYTVFFEHGEWEWALNTQADGRVQFAHAPNPPHYDIGSYSLARK